jgi:hypothetical protein
MSLREFELKGKPGVVRRYVHRGVRFAFLVHDPEIGASVPADRYGNWAALNDCSLFPLPVYIRVPNRSSSTPIRELGEQRQSYSIVNGWPRTCSS